MKFKIINTNSSPPGKGTGVGHVKPINYFEFYRQLQNYFFIILSPSEETSNRFYINILRLFIPFRMTTIFRFCNYCIVMITALFLISSCSIRGYKPITNHEDGKMPELYIFGSSFEKSLYKTSIVIYGNNLTGLTLIKKTDSAYRVVFMSELGIKYFDFEFPFDQQKPAMVHYIMEPLNKKLLVNMIKKDFTLLFFTPEIIVSEILINNKDDSKMLVKSNNLVYFFNSSGMITRIANQRKSIISLSGFEQPYPETINIDHGKIMFDFEVID